MEGGQAVSALVSLSLLLLVTHELSPPNDESEFPPRPPVSESWFEDPYESLAVLPDPYESVLDLRRAEQGISFDVAVAAGAEHGDGTHEP